MYEGKTAGTYVAGNNHDNPHVINQPAMMSRIWKWLIWRYNLTDIREWDRTWWMTYRIDGDENYDDIGIDYSLAPYRNPWVNADCKYGPGTCELFYPPCKDGFCSISNNPETMEVIVPSIRGGTIIVWTKAPVSAT